MICAGTKQHFLNFFFSFGHPQWKVGKSQRFSDMCCLKIFWVKCKNPQGEIDKRGPICAFWGLNIWEIPWDIYVVKYVLKRLEKIGTTVFWELYLRENREKKKQTVMHGTRNGNKCLLYNTQFANEQSIRRTNYAQKRSFQKARPVEPNLYFSTQWIVCAKTPWWVFPAL